MRRPWRARFYFPVTPTAIASILAAGAATSVGALGLLVFRRPSERVLDALLGFTAGIMLAATVFSLLVPALERGGLAEVLFGFALGGGTIALLDAFVPHLHTRFLERGRELAGAEPEALRRSLLLLAAMTIHNVPEGLAVGVAFAAGGADLGVPIAIAIGIQNVPEGFAAATPLLGSGSPSAAAALAAVTGVVEPPAAFSALAAFGVVSVLLPAGLAFAAGAMAYVVVDELIPESHARGYEREASLALLVGFALMTALDRAFS